MMVPLKDVLALKCKATIDHHTEKSEPRTERITIAKHDMTVLASY
jgi:hypothetical protein